LMVTHHVATGKAFGVADEEEGEGRTAKPPSRQEEERERVWVCSERRRAS